MKSELDQAYCMKVLGPHLKTLSDIFHSAFDLYQRGYPTEIKAEHTNTTAANCVHSHVLKQAARQFAAIRGTKIINARGLRLLNVGDKVVGRFKKVDGAGRSQSFGTLQTKAYDRQLPLPLIPSAATRLTFGYEPDVAFTKIDRILVSCPLGKTILWCAQILSEVGQPAWIDITPGRIPGTEPYRRFGEDKGNAKG